MAIEKRRKTAHELLTDGYAASTPIKKPPLRAGDWPGEREEWSEEMERIRASLSPHQRMCVGYARLRRENNR